MCYPGYSFTSDGLQCEGMTMYYLITRYSSNWNNADIDECMIARDRCSQDCIDQNSTFTCTCYEGFTLNEDGRTCRESQKNSGVGIYNNKNNHY